MGLFGLFGDSKAAKKKKAVKYLRDCEKACADCPTAGLMGEELCGQVLGVYLSGQLKYDGTVYELPEEKSYAKAEALIREGVRPENCRKMRKRYGKQWSDPTTDVEWFLAVCGQSQETRDAIIRKYMFTNYPVAYYLYSKDLLDRYCAGPEDRARIFLLLTGCRACTAETDADADYGMQHWKWQEFYGLTRNEDRQRQAQTELKDMLYARDKKLRRAAEHVVEESRQKQRQEREALRTYQQETARFAQDELGMQLVDQEGNRLKMHKDGTVTRQKD